MKVATVFILTFFLLIQTFCYFFTLTAFKINNDFIVKKLCENRDRPALQCEGNCVFMRKMKKHQKKEQDHSVVSSTVLTGVISCRSFFLSAANLPALQVQADFTIRNEGKPIDQISLHFHPPCFRMFSHFYSFL